MSSRVRTETETVIKRILPYLKGRGYDIEADLTFEEASPRTHRYGTGYIDILVTCGRTKPIFLVEAKKASKNLTRKDREQAIEYGQDIKVPFVIVTNGTQIQSFNANTEKAILWNGRLIDKIPAKWQLKNVISTLKTDPEATDIALPADATLPFRPGLPLKPLNELFKRSHNAIRKIEKNEEHAFADFSKLLFLKLLEEKSNFEDFSLPYSYRFHELAAQPSSESDQVKNAILKMLEEIRNHTPYGEVLEDTLRLKNPKTFQYIVRQLAAVCFSYSSLDSKGAAFEYYVRATLKGKKLGQYFTPRPLVAIMSCLIGEDKLLNSLLAGSDVKVHDPACGTGGFLIYLMQTSLKHLNEKYHQNKITKQTNENLIKKIKLETFFGSDANDSVASSAKMNMIIVGDGHTNIIAEDSLPMSAQNWKIDNPDCDIILTNPPFGTSEAGSLSSQDLESYPIRTTRGQLLFLQKMVLCTVPGGEICTVIDEGVLNTASAAQIRHWLFSKCKILTVVRLPEETFKPNKINVKASILYMRRREVDDLDLEDDYQVVFCELLSLGYNGAGESIRKFDFNQLKKEISQQVLNLKAGTTRSGYHWRAFNITAQTVLADPNYRLDHKYWAPEVRKRIEGLCASPHTISIGELTSTETNRGKSPPVTAYVDEKEGYALVVKAGSNISKYGELIEDGDFIEKNIYEEMEKIHLQEGDILLSSTGTGTLGKCCVFRSKRPAIADGHVTIIRVDSEVVHPEYLADYLRVGFGAVQIERLYTGSTGLIEITPEEVDVIVVDLLDRIEAQKRKSQQLRSKERKYKQLVEKAEHELSEAQTSFLAR